jgi:hypothetical protein
MSTKIKSILNLYTCTERPKKTLVIVIFYKVLPTCHINFCGSKIWKSFINPRVVRPPNKYIYPKDPAKVALCSARAKGRSPVKYKLVFGNGEVAL